MQKKIKIPEISRKLTTCEDGIWMASQKSSVSYPEDGNESCFLLEDSSFWFQHRNECILAVVKQSSTTGPILDIGGGNGYVTRRLIDEGIQTILLEPGIIGVYNAKRQRHVPQIIFSTLENACFEKNSIPGVCLFDVLEHIKDDRAFVEHLYVLLSPGGLLYMTMPAHNWLWSLSDVRAGHYRRYNEAMLVNLLIACTI